MMKKISGFPLVFLLMFSIGMTSCVTQKQVKYLQKRQADDTTSSYLQKRGPNYKLQPYDNLYIKIFSLDEKSYFFFNRQNSGLNSYNDYTESALYLNSYTVNDSGYIDFPVVGKIYVKDHDVEQIKAMVQNKISQYLKETSIIVKLVNFKITVLGEVRTPGEKKIYQDQLNIFEGISMAGDLTDFADRGKVALIRKTGEGSKIIYLDLNSSNLLVSPYYQLQPNDIIYVAPLNIKRWGSETFPWALIFAGVTSLLLIMNYFK
ncbi:MAG: polysaccharide biosynthesis/export family protein [Syntrophothermus sp.]